jgi:hypothetical protein
MFIGDLLRGNNANGLNDRAAEKTKKAVDRVGFVSPKTQDVDQTLPQQNKTRKFNQALKNDNQIPQYATSVKYFLRVRALVQKV